MNQDLPTAIAPVADVPNVCTTENDVVYEAQTPTAFAGTTSASSGATDPVSGSEKTVDSASNCNSSDEEGDDFADTQSCVDPETESIEFDNSDADECEEYGNNCP